MICEHNISQHIFASPTKGPLSPVLSEGVTSDPSNQPAVDRGSPLPGILRLQSPLVKECITWVNKFKSGLAKKGETCFEIQTILTSSGEKLEVIKSAIESFISILDQHKSKTSKASNRGRSGKQVEREASSSGSSSQSGDDRES
jgi:hypothetical protein